MLKWLFIFCYFGCMGATMSVYAQGGEKAPAAIAGQYVIDNTVAVPAGAYTTFSTVYEGKRYYLGIDTLQAKAGKDTVAWFDKPCYEAMWVVGGLYNPRATKPTDVLPDKNYQRAIESLWIRERCSRKRYLALGEAPTGVTYNPLILRDSSTSVPNGAVAIWYTQKDSREQSKYIQGFMYYYSDASGVDLYRYLTFNPLYGFSRAYSVRPEASQRISVWDRKTGEDLVFQTKPTAYTFGLKTSEDTTKIRFSSHVAYYPHVDRFRSRYARVDVYTSEPEVIDDQSVLVSTYHMSGHYEWKSNPRGAGAYNGQSHMKMWTQTGDSTLVDDDSNPETPDVKVPVIGWKDSTLFWVSDTKNRLIDNEWVDTIFVIGKSPIDRPECRVLRKTSDAAPTEGDYLDHVDWLYVHLYLGEDESKKTHYVDSIQLTRETFHVKYSTTLTMDERPDGWEFPYFYDGKKADEITPIGTDDTKDFDITGRYRVTADTLHYNGACETGGVLEEQPLNLTAQTPREIGGVRYNELIVNAYDPGTTTPCSWLTLTTPDRKTIRMVADEYDPYAATTRIAEVHYTYRYLHSTQEGDWAEVTRIVWISQLHKGAGVAGLYEFNHKPTKTELQEVYEKKYTMYAIPGEDMFLPVHRDYWGYYRWFIYNPGQANHDHDLEYGEKWDYGLNAPTNVLNLNFMPINFAVSPASRGRWDVIRDINAGNTEFEPASKEHFTVGTRTNIPAVAYPNSITENGKVACDISAYYDIETEGSSDPAYVNQNLTSLTEPTLSYRNVFDIQPAKIQADTLAKYKGNGSAAKWMEEHVVIVPAGRKFSLHQQYPVRQGDASINEEHLQYIYYANPTQTDAKIGTRDGLTDKQLEENDYYARIGKEKTIEKKYVLTLRNVSWLNNWENKDPKTIVLVNPRTGTGYFLGRTTHEIPATLPLLEGATTKAAFKDSLEKKLNSGTNTAYLMTMTYNRQWHIGGYEYYHTFSKGDYILYNLLTAIDPDGLEHGTNNIRWYDGWATGSSRFEFHTYTGPTTNLPSGFSSGDFVTIRSTRADQVNVKGYLASGKWDGGLFNYRIYRRDDKDDKNNEYAAWLVYEVSETKARTYNETPWWEKWNGSAWVEVERASDEDADGYTMLADGSLHFDNSVHTEPNETIQYRLLTRHFQLAKFTVVTRDKNIEGPLNYPAIISEEDIHSNYEILFSLGLENFPAPAPGDTAYYHKLPWSMSELSYHYPQTVIPANRRVDGTSLLPMRGEYCFLNKFKDPTNASHVISARDTYFMCIQAAEKPTTIFNFTYSDLPCSDQQIYLSFDICNPVNNGYEPQITAELQGTKDGGSTWTAIYRFKTGEIEYNRDGNAQHDWWQTVLPIDRKKVEGYDYFRCTASLMGTTESDAYVLIDRLRFIAKERPMTVFQNKSACLESELGGDVYLTARLDYKNISDTINLVAFQYQKKVGANFVALRTDAEAGGAGAGDIDSYLNDASVTPLTDQAGKSCGVIRIPRRTHVPCNGTTPCDSIVTMNNVTTKKKCYVNEGTEDDKYYAMYLSQQVHALVGDTFRVAMALIPDAETQPNFATVGCAAERVIPIDNPVEIHVNGAASKWPNSERKDLDRAGTPDADNKLRPANATYSATLKIADAFLPTGKSDGSGKCMFDVVRTAETDRKMDADDWFKSRFGCTRSQFREYMTIFRQDHEDNPMKMETNWHNIRPVDFTYDGRSQEQADTIYNVLNRLVEKGLLVIGVSSYDIYLADNNNSYAVFWPIPASGTYVDATYGETHKISVCATPRWFEIHSDESDYDLRFGYDNLQEGNYYMTPVIRATVTEANTGLKVRIADITHAGSSGLVIGWDSTYVIDSNDPTWNSTKSFRYHQDRIVQDTLFASYYHVPTTGTKEQKEADPHRYVTFTPVNNTYISQLQATDCACYDYTANGSTYDTNPITGVFTQQAASGCNKWHVAPTAGYQTANNFELKAGYWYKFKTAFFGVAATIEYDAGGDGTCLGHSEFIVAVAPDTLRWTPSHPDGANYWNDDNNWTPVMHRTPADGFKAKVPMGDSHVIIPAPATDNLLPIVNNTVPRRIDTLDYGFAKNTCKKVLFKPRATMLGQENLDYEKAFVDVPLATAEYMTFSPALKYIYAGDMYIPKVADNVDFDPKEFKDPSTPYSATYNRKTPYAMYAAYYNQTVPFAYYNTDTEGNDLSYKSRSSADWVFTNTMKMPLTPGTACLLLAYDKSGANADSLIVRLPKKETAYPYIGKKPDGSWGTGSVETMEGKPAFGDLSNNLAFNKTDLAEARTAAGSETAGITYTLTNETPSKVFFFGNPTMALIDVYKLCQDNDSKLEKGGSPSSYRFTAYQLREGEASYSTRVITGPGQFFVAPQRSVGLIAIAACTSLEVELRPEALVAMADGGAITVDTITFSAPRRTISNDQLPITNYLYMSAANETDGGLCKAYLTIGQSAEASRSYVAGEDALNLSSGTSNNVAYETPLSMYTIAGNEALMLDVRDSIGTIPLVFATLPDYEYEDYTLLSFAFEGHWSTPLYLYDALTNDSIQITNGLQVAVRTPESDQIRYFINGNGARTSTDDDQPGITTDIEVVDDQSPITNNQSGTVIYDVLGRPVLKLSEHDLISNIQLPTGVYIIQRGKNTERMVIR